MLTLQITAVILISGALGGMLLFTDVYDDVHSQIVSVLCLSCIKLQPKTELDFTFATANGEPHPAFVLENLTRSPMFLFFSEDACQACDIMEPVIKQLFSVDFEKTELFYETVSFNGANITVVYMNIDHAPAEYRASLARYDKENISGLPMFTLITLGYDHGVVRPYYASVYGTLDPDTDEERKTLLTKIVLDGIDLYTQNHEGYTKP